MNEAHEKTRIRQLEDAAAHWEHKYANARQYNRNLEERCQKLEAALRETYEIYAGSDGFIPETAAEAYQQRVIKQMVERIGHALNMAASETKGDGDAAG